MAISIPKTWIPDAQWARAWATWRAPAAAGVAALFGPGCAVALLAGARLGCPREDGTVHQAGFRPGSAAAGAGPGLAAAVWVVVGKVGGDAGAP